MNGNRGGRRVTLGTVGWGLLAAASMVGTSPSGRAQEAAPASGPPQATDAAAQAAPEGDPAAESSSAFTPVDPALLTRLVSELEDDHFGVREKAQKQLAALGGGALEAVAAAAVQGSLESSTRSVGILLAWADGSDRQLSLAALEKLALLTSRPTEAAMADERLAEVRELAAVEAIKKLGGRFDYDRYYGMVGGPQRAVQVVIGPQWRGGADGLRHVADVRSATTLSLYSAPLADDAVDALTSLPHLKRMELYGMELSAETLGKVQQQLPQTQFDIRRGGARLGVRGLNCEQVLPDSPAHKAGLKEQDRIVEFAGKSIESFEQLTEQITACKPGDSKPITVQRLNSKTGALEAVALTVTFDRWGDDPRPASGMGEGADPFGLPRRAQAIRGQIIIQGGGAPRIQVLPGVQPGALPIDLQPIPDDRR